MAHFRSSVQAFEDILNESFNSYVSLSNKIGGPVKTHSDMVYKAVQIHRHFLIMASKSKKPNEATLMWLLKPTSDSVQQIQEFREKNTTNEYFIHLSAISESIPALGWVTIEWTPGPYVKEMADVAQYYTNKVLVTYKNRDPTHVEWGKAWMNFLRGVQAFIKQYHTTGLTWNPRGVDATAPQPPPPPPPGFFEDPNKGGADDRSALFAQLNRGTDITKALKTLSADRQTHQKPNLRVSSVVPDKPTASGAAVASPPKAVTRGAPKFGLEGKKWIVENQSGEQNLFISDTVMNQSINVYKCENCVLTVKGKVNSITVDHSKRFSIVFEDIVSVVEIINSQKIEAQSMGVVPTITLDKVDNIQIYLADESLGCEIVSSKSSGINVSVRDDTTGDFVEHSIPEQLKSVWTGKGFRTDAVIIA